MIVAGLLPVFAVLDRSEIPADSTATFSSHTPQLLPALVLGNHCLARRRAQWLFVRDAATGCATTPVVGIA